MSRGLRRVGTGGGRQDGGVGRRVQPVDEVQQGVGPVGAQDLAGAGPQALADLVGRGRGHVVEGCGEDLAAEEMRLHPRALFRREGGGEGGIGLEGAEGGQPGDGRVVQIVEAWLGEVAVGQGGGDAEADAHLGLQRALERSRGVAAGIAEGGIRNAHRDGGVRLRA